MAHDLSVRPVGWPLAEPLLALPPEDIYGNTKKLRFVIEALDRQAHHLGHPPSLLDFGCGNAMAVGRFLADGQRNYLGVDFHEASLHHARSVCSLPNTVFQSALPVHRSFDALVYADVLEHLEHPTDILKTHLGQLADDGIVVGSVPNGWGPCEMEKWLIRTFRLYDIARGAWRLGKRIAGRSVSANAQYPPYNSESGHVVFFSLGMLKAMADDAGLVIRRLAHGGFIGADLTGATIFRSPKFVDWNVTVADRLPSRMVSTWYFEMVRVGGPLDVN